MNLRLWKGALGGGQLFGESRVAGVLRGLQNRCRPVSQAEVGSIPTLSANSMDEDLGKTRGQDGNASPSIADFGNCSKTQLFRFHAAPNLRREFGSCFDS